MAISGGSGGGGSGNVRAGGAFVELFTKDAELVKGLEHAKKLTADAAAFLAKAGAGFAGVGSAILAPIMASFKSAVGEGATVGKMAERLGLTTEAMSELAFAARATGTEIEDLAHHSDHLQTRLMEAAEGAGDAARAFAEAGLNANELLGMNRAEQIDALAEAMQNWGSANERAGTLAKVAGQRFADSIGEMIRKGPEGLARLRDNAHRFGAIVTPEEAEESRAITRAINETYAALHAATRKVGVALLPLADAIKSVAGKIQDVIVSTRIWVENNGDLFRSIAGVGAGLLATGTALLGLAAGLSAASYAAGGVVTLYTGAGAVLAALLSPVGLATAAVAGLTAAFLTMTDEGKSLSTWVGKTLTAAFESLKETAATTWAGISNALKAGDLELAFKVGVAGLKTVWADFTTWATRKWADFKATFVDGWHDAVKLAKLALVDLGEAMDRTVGKKAQVFGAKALAATPLGVALALLAPDALKAVGAGAGGGGDAMRQEIENQARKDQEDRDNARKKDAQQAAIAAGFQRLALLGLAGEKAGKLSPEQEKLKNLADQVSSLVRGMFAGIGSNLSGFFFGGTPDTVKAIAANTKETADGVRQLVANGGGKFV